MAGAIITRYPALGYPLYRRWWTASFFSVGATQLVTLGMGWLVYELSESALDLGVLGAAAAIPNVVLSLLGGAARAPASAVCGKKSWPATTTSAASARAASCSSCTTAGRR